MTEPFFWNLTRPTNLTFTLEESQEKKRNDGLTPVPRTTCICGSWSFGATIVDEDAAWLLSWAICAISDQSRTDTSKRERDACMAGPGKSWWGTSYLIPPNATHLVLPPKQKYGLSSFFLQICYFMNQYLLVGKKMRNNNTNLKLVTVNTLNSCRRR